MVIAIAPQYSIDRDIVPWESRWRKSANRIGTFIHRLEDHIDERAKKIVASAINGLGAEYFILIYETETTNPAN